jgi:hypothetical protein
VRDRGFGRSLRNGFGVHIKTHMNQKVHNQSMCGYDYKADVHLKKPDTVEKSFRLTVARTLLDCIDSFIHAPEVLKKLSQNISLLNYFLFKRLLK